MSDRAQVVHQLGHRNLVDGEATGRQAPAQKVCAICKPGPRLNLYLLIVSFQFAPEHGVLGSLTIRHESRLPTILCWRAECLPHVLDIDCVVSSPEHTVITGSVPKPSGIRNSGVPIEAHFQCPDRGTALLSH